MASLWHHLLALSYTSHILFRCFASFVMFSMPLIWTLMINVWPMQYATVKIFWIAATGSSIHKWPSARTGQPPSLAVSGHCRISRVTWRHLFTCTYTAQWSHQLTRPPQHWYRNRDNINKCLHLKLWHLPAKPQNLIIRHTLHCHTVSHHYYVTFQGVYTLKLPVTNHHLQQLLFGLIVFQLTILLPMTFHLNCI